MSGHSLPFVGGVASLAAGLATGLGALPVFLMGRITLRQETVLLGFGAGVMLAAAFFALLNPAIVAGLELTGNKYYAVLMAVAGFLSGAAIFYVSEKFLPHEHFIVGLEGADPGKLRRIWLFVIAITIHNFPEGMSVGVGFGGHDARNGLILALGIGLQNMPEGLVVAAALAAEGYRRVLAFLVALLTGLVEPVGAVFGAGVITLANTLLPAMMALAAGAMIYVISDEIIPETHRKGFERYASTSLMFGFVVMMFLDVTLG